MQFDQFDMQTHFDMKEYEGYVMRYGFEGRVDIQLVNGIGKKKHLSKIRSFERKLLKQLLKHVVFSQLLVEGHGIPQRSAAGCFTSRWKIGHGS